MTSTVYPAPVIRTRVTTGFAVRILCYTINRARCCAGRPAAFAGFVRAWTLARSIFPAAGLADAGLRISAGHEVGTADTFVIITTVVGAFFVWRLY